MLVPDFGQHGTAGLFQDRSSLFLFCRESRRPAPRTPFAACIPGSYSRIKA
jgi:hypothetical protein